MSVYKVDFDSSKKNIVFKDSSKNKRVYLNLSSLVSVETGLPFKNDAMIEKNYIKTQNELNYLDSMKDFKQGDTNVTAAKVLLNNLKIYDVNQTFSNNKPTIFEAILKNWRKEVIDKYASKIHYTSWSKPRKGTPLNQPKNYEEIIWESGLGIDKFIISSAKRMKNFGSYIDPLSKSNADFVFPENNSTIEISQAFMKLMGFGNSKLIAKTMNQNDHYNYNMIINLPHSVSCNNDTKCVIEYNSGITVKDPNITFFAGNAEKSKIVKKSSNTDDKIKTIILKEWGDKMQVLIYFVYYNLISKEITMTTCDFVVFIFCISLNLPCIFTGKQDTNDNKIKVGKFYSIQEFKPSETPNQDAQKRFNKLRTDILEENENFIELIKHLQINNIILEFAGDDLNIQDPSFYQNIIDDMENIQNILKNNIEYQEIKSFNTTSQADSGLINSLLEQEKEMKHNCLIIQFIKYYKNQSKYKLFQHSRYTKKVLSSYIDSKSKNVQLNLNYNNNIPFYKLATAAAAGGSTIHKNKKQIGGAINNSDYEFDDSEYISIFEKSDIDDHDQSIKDLYDEFNTFDTIPDDDSYYSVDLQKIFNFSLETSFDSFIFNQNIEMKYKDTLKDTIKNFLNYEAYFENTTNIYIEESDIENIINDYSIDLQDVSLPSIEQFSNQASEPNTTNKKSPSPPKNSQQSPKGKTKKSNFTKDKSSPRKLFGGIYRNLTKKKYYTRKNKRYSRKKR